MANAFAVSPICSLCRSLPSKVSTAWAISLSPAGETPNPFREIKSYDTHRELEALLKQGKYDELQNEALNIYYNSPNSSIEKLQAKGVKYYAIIKSVKITINIFLYLSGYSYKFIKNNKEITMLPRSTPDARGFWGPGPVRPVPARRQRGKD